MSALLAAVCALLIAAALWQLAAERSEDAGAAMIILRVSAFRSSAGDIMTSHQ